MIKAKNMIITIVFFLVESISLKLPAYAFYYTQATRLFQKR